MKPEDLVPSRETCIALKEAGFPQTTDYDNKATYFAWYTKEDGTFELWCAGCEDGMDEYLCSAPTLGEILEQLREHSAQVGWSRPGQVSPEGVWHAFRPGDELTLQFDTNPAEAAARLWIEVKEENP